MPKQPSHQPASKNNLPETVDPVWLLKTAGAVVLLAAFCGYLVICTLFYRSQWQLVLHPSRVNLHQPSEYQLAAQELRFGPRHNTAPELFGWWIPGPSKAAPTVLMLSDGNGSAADLLARASTFHQMRWNVLLFDYRGAGRSLGQHPTQKSMNEDARAALQMISTRGIETTQTMLYGRGLGASLAVALVEQQPQLAALILEAPDGDLEDRVRKDPRTSLVPFHLLFRESFPLAASLQTQTIPKLFLSNSDTSLSPFFEQAASPKMRIILVPNTSEEQLERSLNNFVSMYTSIADTSLKP